MTIHFDSAMHTDTAYVELYDVAEFYICGCEFSIIFKENHNYKTIEEIDLILNKVGIHVGNFYFKEGADEETSILCMIPENIRDSFSALVTE